MWDTDDRDDIAVFLYDSMHVANMVQGLREPKSSVPIIRRIQIILDDIRLGRSAARNPRSVTQKPSGGVHNARALGDNGGAKEWLECPVHEQLGSRCGGVEEKPELRRNSDGVGPERRRSRSCDGAATAWAEAEGKPERKAGKPEVGCFLARVVDVTGEENTSDVKAWRRRTSCRKLIFGSPTWSACRETW